MKHRLLMDSGFGRYLIGKQPKAIANEFLYHQPSLLLWVDELICDKHALAEEAAWADEGFLVSQLSLRLHEEEIIREEDFGGVFQGEAKDNLLRASKIDSFESREAGLTQYSTPDPNAVGQYSGTGFHDVNSLLYLSTVLGVSYLNTRPATDFYKWKFARLAKAVASIRSAPGSDLTVELPVLSEVLSLAVPSFELFPRDDNFTKAEAAKQSLLVAGTAYSRGELSEAALDKEYKAYLRQWLRYDKSVRSVVRENFDLLMEFRGDKRLRSLRLFLNDLSESVTRQPGDEDFIREVTLRFKREVKEVEIAIAEDASTFEFLDKCTSYVSFPIEAVGVIGGIAASFLAENPLFAALGSAPSFVKWVADGISDVRRRRFAWHYYLLDFKEKIDRTQELRALEKEIKQLGRSV